MSSIYHVKHNDYSITFSALQDALRWVGERIQQEDCFSYAYGIAYRCIVPNTFWRDPFGGEILVTKLTMVKTDAPP